MCRGAGVPIKPSTGWGTRRYAPTGIRVSRAVPRTPVTSVIVLAPLKRSWAPFTGRGAQAGSPTRSAGQVGPAITVTVNDPKCPARVDWPQPAAMTTRPQIASRCLTSVSDPPERSVVPADHAEDARRWASRSGLACADSSVDALDSACATGSRPARWWVRAQRALPALMAPYRRITGSHHATIAAGATSSAGSSGWTHAPIPIARRILGATPAALRRDRPVGRPE